MAARVRSEAGFTLLEILIAVTLLGIVTTALGASSFVAYRTVARTSNSLVSTTDAQFLSIYLPSDIKSADAGAGSTAVPASITCTGTTLRELKLTSNAYSLGGVAATVVIVYWVKTVAGPPITYQLVRSVCTSGTATTSTVVVRNLVSSTAVVTTGIGVTPFTGFSMAVTEKKAVRDPTSFIYTVSGRFRTGILS